MNSACLGRSGQVSPMFSRSQSNIEFVMIAEAGILESQALLLCESIRRFAGA